MSVRRAAVCACVLLTIALCVFVPVLFEKLPLDNTEMVAEKYGGWSGVLHVVTAEGPFSPTGWLARQAAAFEKEHPGVYVRIESAAGPAAEAIAKSSALAPDALVFPPGTLASGDMFVPPDAFPALSASAQTLRVGLEACGRDGGALCALPIAMDVYALIRAAGAPEELSELRLCMPPDDAENSFSAAALCLFSGSYTKSEANLGRDIVLTLPSAAPTAAPAQEEYVPVPPPAELSAREDALTAFANGEADALVGGADTLAALASLSGRTPAYAVSLPGEFVFSDRIALMGILKNENADKGRAAAAAEFLAFLLSEESQQALAFAKLFPVTRTQAYGAQAGFAEAETALFAKPVLVPGAFSGTWRARAEDFLREYTEGSATARNALIRLAEICR